MKRRSSSNLEAVEGVLRGSSRPYADACRLQLIDLQIKPLVDAMNISGVIETIACCEGHGGFGGFSTPYVAFATSIELAARLNEELQADSLMPQPRLCYHWEVTGFFGKEREILFLVKIPAIDRYRWVTRRRLNADFLQIRSMLEQALDVPAFHRHPSAVPGRNPLMELR